MIKTKLFRALKALSRIELNRLLKFAQGEQPEVAVKLLTFLIEAQKDDRDAPSRAQSFEMIYPGLVFHDLKFRKACTDALQLLERFLSIEFYFSDPLQEATSRLMALARRDMHSLYKSHLLRVDKLMSRLPEQGANYYYHRFQVEQQKYQTSQANLQRFEITNIEQILSNLDIFYVIEKLRFYCEILSRKTFVKHHYQNRLINEILRLVESGTLLDIPVVAIYYKIVCTHLYPDEKKYYFELKEAVQAHAEYLPLQHRKEVFDSILNYCNRRINEGHQEFLRESLDHYQAMLDNELIFVDSLITHWTFKNVVVLALRLGEYTWAEMFISRFADRIEPIFRENAVKYNLAQLYFYKKDYSQVLRLLQEVEYADVSYNLGAKTMLLATYYELDEDEALRALGDSFRAFINRRQKTIPETRRKSYLNLISYTIKLTRIHREDHTALAKLAQSLNDVSTVASEHWIKSKVSERIAQARVSVD